LCYLQDKFNGKKSEHCELGNDLNYGSNYQNLVNLTQFRFTNQKTAIYQTPKITTNQFG
jgi:hypothetical protein